MVAHNWSKSNAVCPRTAGKKKQKEQGSVSHVSAPLAAVVGTTLETAYYAAFVVTFVLYVSYTVDAYASPRSPTGFAEKL